jgi:hypothetical protein
MSEKIPTPSDKDQFPHSDVANNEEGGVPEDFERSTARERQKRGNEGPADEPGFGQGA